MARKTATAKTETQLTSPSVTFTMAWNGEYWDTAGPSYVGIDAPEAVREEFEGSIMEVMGWMDANMRPTVTQEALPTDQENEAETDEEEVA